MERISSEERLKAVVNFKKLRRFFERSGKKKIDIIPVVVQNFHSRKILILAHANERALAETLRTKKAVFWSITRNKLWLKGEESGNFLEVKEILIDCENASAIYLVEPKGGACHTKDRRNQYRESCFFKRLEFDGKRIFLSQKGE